MLNIVIPMAGNGLRFKNMGFPTPKPLIKVYDFEILSLVIRNITPKIPHRFIFIVKRDLVENFQLFERLAQWVENSEFKVVVIDEDTDGAAKTILYAKHFIYSKEPVLIANCDQLVDFDIDDFIKFSLKSEKIDGTILTFYNSDPKWSYIRLLNDEVVEVAEKKVISNLATVGLYFFKTGVQFIQHCESMISQQIKTNNEFYIAPVYNQFIQNGQIIKNYNIGHEGFQMFGLGTPEDLKKFLSNEAGLSLIRRIKQCH